MNLAKRFHRRAGLSPVIIGLGFLLTLTTACRFTDKRLPVNQKPNVVATTTIVGDVVRSVAGETINLTILLPPNADVHGFEPSPQETTLLANADLIFTNGAGLEPFIQRLAQNVSSQAKIVAVSEGIDLRRLEKNHQGEPDPHVWFNPQNIIVWTDNIQQTLSDLDPENRPLYSRNAQDYRLALQELDGWILDRVALIPPAKRMLVSDHDSLGYFSDRYGFKVIGSVVPGLSTLAEPSAKELGELEKAVINQAAPAIFVGITTNQDLAEQVAKDTGTKLIPLYVGSLSEPDGPADSYLKLMRHNVQKIVNALQ